MGDGSFRGDRGEVSWEHATVPASPIRESARSRVDRFDSVITSPVSEFRQTQKTVVSIAGLSLPELMTRLERFRNAQKNLTWAERNWRPYYTEQIQEMERHVSRRLQDQLRHQLQVRKEAPHEINLESLHAGANELEALANAKELERSMIPLWQVWRWPERAQLTLDIAKHREERQALLTNINALKTAEKLL
jgi:hypothetical protein